MNADKYIREHSDKSDRELALDLDIAVGQVIRKKRDLGLSHDSERLPDKSM